MTTIDEQPDEPTEVTDKELNTLIDMWLSDARPERYEVDETDWMEPVFKKARTKLTERSNDDVIADAARRRVKDREGRAVQRMHGELRRLVQGEVPLGWPAPGEEWTEDGKKRLAELLHLPLKIGPNKVQFGTMSAEDWQKWRLDSQRVTDEANQRAIDERRMAVRLQELTEAQGVSRTDQIRF